VDASEVTRQIISAWDDIVEEEEQPTDDPDEQSTEEQPAEEEETTEDGEETQEEEVAPQEDEAEKVEEEEAEEESEDEDEEEGEPSEPEYETEDIEVRAFLAKYGGSLDKALKGAAELSHVVGRQGMEKSQLQQRVDELEEEASRLRLSASADPMNDEQRNWVEQAVASGNPTYFVQQAVDAGEWGLARAVCAEWGQEDAYNASRIRQQVDAAEYEVSSQPQVVDIPLLLKTMAERDPEFRSYEPQMLEMMERLGPDHRLMQDAKSGDLGRTVNGLLGVYELAKVANVSVSSARERVKAEQRQSAENAKKKASVSSGSASPASETPRRKTQLMPGLTLDELEAAFAGQ